MDRALGESAALQVAMDRFNLARQQEVQDGVWHVAQAPGHSPVNFWFIPQDGNFAEFKFYKEDTVTGRFQVIAEKEENLLQLAADVEEVDGALCVKLQALYREVKACQAAQRQQELEDERKHVEFERRPKRQAATSLTAPAESVEASRPDCGSGVGLTPFPSGKDRSARLFARQQKLLERSISQARDDPTQRLSPAASSLVWTPFGWLPAPESPDDYDAPEEERAAPELRDACTLHPGLSSSGYDSTGLATSSAPLRNSTAECKMTVGESLLLHLARHQAAEAATTGINQQTLKAEEPDDLAAEPSNAPSQWLPKDTLANLTCLHVAAADGVASAILAQRPVMSSPDGFEEPPAVAATGRAPEDIHRKNVATALLTLSGPIAARTLLLRNLLTHIKSNQPTAHTTLPAAPTTEPTPAAPAAAPVAAPVAATVAVGKHDRRVRSATKGNSFAMPATSEAAGERKSPD
eukprot:GHVT01088337.1.p1 GENE.GHVT01088337.1~~GHVT01088337.1.p1  ORF type:complete len:466 (-),score=122.29 GHVT01088337.1:3669-5066(-)